MSLAFEEVHTKTIESLGKNVKTNMRQWQIKNSYLAAISRYYFMHILNKEEQLKVLVKGLNSKVMPGFEMIEEL